MAHYNIRLDLSKLKHVIREMPKQGGGTTKVVILDGPSNELFFSEKGGIYLDLVAFENKEIKFDNTHSIKQSFSKETREKMTEEQRKSMPFVGNMKPTGVTQNSTSAPAASAGLGTMPDFDTPAPTSSTPDDLPF